jgi:uncharacterized Fe-S center protein
MTQLLLDQKLAKMDDSEIDHMNEDELINYRGYFANEDEPEERYFEYGSHFPYKILFKKLEMLYKTLSPSRKEKVEPKQEIFRKISEPKINKESRNNVIKKIVPVSKNIRIPLNVTENMTLLKNRNSKIIEQKSIIKNTFTKKLITNKPQKTTNFCSSFSIDILKKKNEKLLFEKTNPVLVLDKSYK